MRRATIRLAFPRRVAALLAAALWLWGALAAPQAPMALENGAGVGGGDQTALVICTAHGLQKVLLDADGAIIDSVPVDGDQSASHDCMCLAGCGGFAAALPESPTVAPPPGFASVEGPTRQAAALSPPVRGPPLGPRGPPSRLG